MTAERARWRPGRVVAKSLGCGACSGALLGILAFAIVVLLAVGLAAGSPGILPGALGAILFFPYAAVVGGVIGMACGLAAAVPMLIVGGADRRKKSRSSRARRDRAALAAAGGAALLPAVFGAWLAARGAEGWAIAWLCVSVVAAAGGMALGADVLYGRRTRPKSARSQAKPDGAGNGGQEAAGCATPGAS